MHVGSNDVYNESTAGASEALKLYNMKLLTLAYYTCSAIAIHVVALDLLEMIDRDRC